MWPSLDEALGMRRVRDREHLLPMRADRGGLADMHNGGGEEPESAVAVLLVVEPPVIDFRGLAALYSWKYASASTEYELNTFVASQNGRASTNTLLELTIDPEIKPVTASRHF